MKGRPGERAAAANPEKLAILGGPRAVAVEAREQWEPPRERIQQAVADLIDRGVYSERGVGTTRELERRFADFVGTRHGLAQNNGTSTLWSAYHVLGVGPGDEVIHPGYSWIGAIAPAAHLGARPVFCEIDPQTLCLDAADVERAITPRTRVISLVHVHGNVCDMTAIAGIARRHGVAVVEDCSHATGAAWDGRRVGSMGDLGCFSMQGDPVHGKPLAAGEGGLLVTSRRDLLDRALFLGHINREGLTDALGDRQLRRLAPTNAGLKFRPHPWAMAAALVLLDGLEERNEKRRAYRRRLLDAVEPIAGLEAPRDPPKALPAGFHGGMHLLYRAEELGGLPRAEFVSALRAEGVAIAEPNPAYQVHRLEVFSGRWDIRRGLPLPAGSEEEAPRPLPRTDEVFDRLLFMPTFVEEPAGYAEQAVSALQKVAERYASLQTRKAKLRRAAARTTRSAARRARRGLGRLLPRRP